MHLSYLAEGRRHIISRATAPEEREPLHPNDTFRVYHGFAETKHAIYTARHGLSGKQRIPRRYSYENNNNPRGLFITLSLDLAKEFSSAMDIAVIMEFSTRARDLEPPVWPAGSYTVQGQKEEWWQSDEERAEGLRKSRDHHSQSKYPAIAQSFDPALAASLYLNREMQALFVGDLNPNQIKRFWIREPTPEGYQLITDKFVPMSRSEFLDYLRKNPDLVDRHTLHTRRHWKTGETERYPDPDEPSGKLFRPNDEFDPEIFMERLHAEYPKDDLQEIVRMLAHEIAEDPSLFDTYYGRFIWPKQEQGLRQFLSTLT